MDKLIGYELRNLGNLIKRKMDNSGCFDHMSHLKGMHIWVIGYLFDNIHRDVYQRDIEMSTGRRRSTVTTMLQNMEQGGLIERQSVAADARLKKIILTEKSRKIHMEVDRMIRDVESEMRLGISESEIEMFFDIITKIKKNLEK